MSDEMPEIGIVIALEAKKPAVAPTVATAPVEGQHSSIHNQQSVGWLRWMEGEG